MLPKTDSTRCSGQSVERSVFLDANRGAEDACGGCMLRMHQNACTPVHATASYATSTQVHSKFTANVHTRKEKRVQLAVSLL